MSYAKMNDGKAEAVVASKDFQRMPQKMRKGWLGSQLQPTHRLVEPKAKKGQPVVWSGEIEKIPAPPADEPDEEDENEEPNKD